MKKIFFSCLPKFFLYAAATIFFVVAVFFISGCAQEDRYEIASAALPDESASYSMGTDETYEEKNETIYVYVCGMVANPGVYELPFGSRVYEAIEAAGGLLEDADATKVNQAQELTDGQQITVYSESESDAAFSYPESGSGKVNINTADAAALMTLSGIGEAKASAIIAYREEHGYFSSTDDIQNVSGIGVKLFEKIKDDIEV